MKIWNIHRSDGITGGAIIGWILGIIFGTIILPILFYYGGVQ